jgi:hypothetical protein
LRWLQGFIDERLPTSASRGQGLERVAEREVADLTRRNLAVQEIAVATLWRICRVPTPADEAPSQARPRRDWCRQPIPLAHEVAKPDS